MLKLLRVIAFVLLCGCLPLLAQTPSERSRRSIPGHKTAAPPTINGDLSDPCWAGAPRSSGFFDDELGTPSPEMTAFRICYDSRAIYVAIECSALQAEIVARETKRGAGFDGEDYVSIELNTFNSMRGEYGNYFSVNPLGTQNAKMAGGRANKQEWEGSWFSAARRTLDGWSVEMAIPWAILDRPDTNGRPSNIGINLKRQHAFRRVDSQWSYMGSPYRPENTGQWIGVEMPPASPARRLSILAYGYGGYDDGRAPFHSGLDARYQINSKLWAIGTLNPDFANIEGDVTSIDFSYSEVLADERRPFFLEGGEYFDDSRHFRSIRIPGFDLGGKVVGRLDAHSSIGALVAHSLGERTDAAFTWSERFSPYTSATVSYVGRHDASVDNDVVAIGWGHNTGHYSFWGRVAGSRDRVGVDGYAVGGFWSEMPVGGDRTLMFSHYASYEHIGRNYRARNGFVPFTGIGEIDGGVGLGKRWDKGPWRAFWLDMGGTQDTRLDGSLFRRNALVHVGGRTSFDLEIHISHNTGRFEQNHDRVTSVFMSYPESNKFQRFGLGFASGRRGGFDYSSFSPSVTWRFGNRLAVGFNEEVIDHERFSQQDVLTASYDFSPERSLGGRLVRRDDRLNWYVSFRNSGYGGIEYFVILGDPNAEEFRERLVFKLIRPF